MYSRYYEILLIFGAIWRVLFLKDGYCCFGRADGEVGELLQQGLVELCKSVRRHFVLSCLNLPFPKIGLDYQRG